MTGESVSYRELYDRAESRTQECLKELEGLRVHAAALEAENTEWKRSSTEKNRSHEEIRDRLRHQLAAKDALVGRLRDLLVDASYLMQYFKDDDAAYRGWREKSKQALADLDATR